MLDVPLVDHVGQAAALEDRQQQRHQGDQPAAGQPGLRDRTAIAGAARLRLIALSATGTDNIDCRAAEERGVAVANTRGYASAAVAQHVFALVLALTNHVSRYDALVRADAWRLSPGFALFDYPIRELTGRKLGVIGYGALGQAVAGIGRCFGMEVLISTRHRDDPQEGRVPFTTILRTADVVSLHCPLTAETERMIGARELGLMKRGALVINVSRGRLVDEEALVAALREGRLRGAGLDVFAEEPLPSDHGLWTLPNVLITPHVSGVTRGFWRRETDLILRNLARYLRGAPIREWENVVDKRAGY